MPIFEDPAEVTGTVVSGTKSVMGVELAGFCVGELFILLLDIFVLSFSPEKRFHRKVEKRRVYRKHVTLKFHK